MVDTMDIIKCVSAEFLASDGPGRVKMCRKLAIEADSLAATASKPETRADYLLLKQQWNMLADEIERAEAELQQAAMRPLEHAIKNETA
jgi:hypothetical protein